MKKQLSLILPLFMFMISSQLFAQLTNASIYGIVKDESGQIIPGATILVRNENTGFSTGTITNNDGMSNRSPLSSGTTNRGPFSISMEAIREFEIITNDYDVVNGRSGGGIVSVVTKSGTNTLDGWAFLFNRADWLASPYDTRGNRRTNEFSVQQYGFTLGGPIIKDKLHFFMAYDGQRDARPLFIADIQTPADEARFNISQTSLDAFLRTARSKYGVADSPQTGSFPNNRYTHTFFGKLDWELNPKNLLSIRNNFTRDLNTRGVSDNSSINLLEVYGDHLSIGIATLKRTIG